MCYWKILCKVFVFDIETALENSKIAIPEWLELQILLTPSQPWLGEINKFSAGSFFWYLAKTEMSCKVYIKRTVVWNGLNQS